MPDPKPKIVKVEGLGTISFPGDMDDKRISESIKANFPKAKTDLPDNSLPDYSGVPAFIRKGIDMGKVSQVVTEPKNEQERNSTAVVSSSDPYKIKVLADDLYGPPIQHHELTHTWQFTRNKDLNPPISTETPKYGPIQYSYGGIAGLNAARKAGKTVSNFNYEQQADMVKDYKFYHDQYLKKAAQGKITPEDERKMYELQQAYHPFIRQLSMMPGQKESMKRNPLLELLGLQKPVPLGGLPEPPGLPRYDTPGLGVLPVDPLMGGKSQSTVPKHTLAQVKEQAAKLNPSLAKKDTLPPQPKEALNQYSNPEEQPPKVSFAFNKKWSKPGPYATKLSPQEEQEFRKWASQNPSAVRGEVGPAPNYDPIPTADYDVRGHFHAGKTGDPSATLVPNKWDGKIHGNDRFKTPYNGGFSNESMYAMPNAPKWVGNKLMTNDGKLVTDETPRKPEGKK